MSKSGYSKTAVTEIIKKFRETGSLEDRKKSGTPPKLSKDDNKYLKTLSLRNKKKLSTELAKDINTATGENVSSSCMTPTQIGTKRVCCNSKTIIKTT